MEKIWYLLIDNKEEGPFSAKEVRANPKVTLETLVWKEGMSDWTPLKKIRELRRFFEPEPPIQDEEELKHSKKTLPAQNELVMEYGFDPGPIFLLILFLLLLIIYLFYR